MSLPIFKIGFFADRINTFTQSLGDYIEYVELLVDCILECIESLESLLDCILECIESLDDLVRDTLDRFSLVFIALVHLASVER